MPHADAQVQFLRKNSGTGGNNGSNGGANKRKESRKKSGNDAPLHRSKPSPMEAQRLIMVQTESKRKVVLDHLPNSEDDRGRAWIGQGYGTADDLAKIRVLLSNMSDKPVTPAMQEAQYSLQIPVVNFVKHKLQLFVQDDTPKQTLPEEGKVVVEASLLHFNNDTSENGGIRSSDYHCIRAIDASKIVDAEKEGVLYLVSVQLHIPISIQIDKMRFMLTVLFQYPQDLTPICMPASEFGKSKLPQHKGMSSIEVPKPTHTYTTYTDH
jgi:hypothetical protein